MKSLYNLTRSAIMGGAIALSTLLPLQTTRAEEAKDLGGLVERLESENTAEKKETKKYGDLRDYLFREDELPEGFRLARYDDLSSKVKKEIGSENNFTNPRFEKNSSFYTKDKTLRILSTEIAIGRYLNGFPNNAIGVIVSVTRRIADGEILPQQPIGLLYHDKKIDSENGIWLQIPEAGVLFGVFFNEGEKLDLIETNYPAHFGQIKESISKLAERIGSSLKEARQRERTDIESRMLAFQKLAEHLNSYQQSNLKLDKLRITNIKTEPFPEEIKRFCTEQSDSNILAAYALNNKEDILDFCRKINELLSQKKAHNEGWRLNPRNTGEVFHWKYDSRRIIIEKFDRDINSPSEKIESIDLDNLVVQMRHIYNPNYLKRFRKDEIEESEIGKCADIILSPDFSKALVTPLEKIASEENRDNNAYYLIDLTRNNISRPFDKEIAPLSFEGRVKPTFSSNGQCLVYTINQATNDKKTEESITALIDMKGNIFEIRKTRVNYRRLNEKYTLLDPEVNSEKNPVITGFMLLSPREAIGTVSSSVQKATDPLSIVRLPGREITDHLMRDGIYEVEKIALFELSNE